MTWFLNFSSDSTVPPPDSFSCPLPAPLPSFLFPLVSLPVSHLFSIPWVFQSTGLPSLNQIWNGEKGSAIFFFFLFLTQGCNYHRYVKFKCTNSDISIVLRLPSWLSGKESACWCRRCGFNTWSGKVPWRRKWQSTPLLLPGKCHGLRSLPGNRPWGRKESDKT